MNSNYNINSILDAINKIHSGTKKTFLNKTASQKSVPSLDHKLILPPDVDRLIREAEEYKKLSINLPKTISTQNENISSEKEDFLILTDEFTSQPESNNQETLELLDKIKILERTEQKLRAEVESLKKNKIINSKTDIDITKQENLNNLSNNAKENLKSIYSQVEEQKRLFLELKKHALKTERDSNVFKENYERLIIENNELKTRLKIVKEQVVNYETNKKDLLSALEQLNEILSKNNIVGKISPKNKSSEISALKEKGNNENID